MQQQKHNFRSENHVVGHKPQQLVIRKAGKTVDVFFGQEGWQWDEWARFEFINNRHAKSLTYMKGAQVPKWVATALRKTFGV